ncbi:hypothetical protein FEP94_03470 [Burkholderia pseudomultivorans]|nr:hypothetical protein [Burkholderia pseudomultivorans]MDR8732721.1 hypothetical protein [Burkholderia pseudomultivorans]MDR8739587.1 hypothetical protein [Burkholderia pseudomultivorans]MDR8778082.1 hypothetical protein [Burkholderia pseudomultivorans]MDR8868749.1 hypothetical protein [Burkholderia pseudomultivorans]
MIVLPVVRMKSGAARVRWIRTGRTRLAMRGVCGSACQAVRRIVAAGWARQASAGAVHGPPADVESDVAILCCDQWYECSLTTASVFLPIHTIFAERRPGSAEKAVNRAHPACAVRQELPAVRRRRDLPADDEGLRASRKFVRAHDALRRRATESVCHLAHRSASGMNALIGHRYSSGRTRERAEPPARCSARTAPEHRRIGQATPACTSVRRRHSRRTNATKTRAVRHPCRCASAPAAPRRRPAVRRQIRGRARHRRVRPGLRSDQPERFAGIR